MKKGVPASFSVAGKAQRQHPRAQKLWTSTTVHGSLESFQSIDLSFRLAVAPRLGDSVPDRVNISAQCAGER